MILSYTLLSVQGERMKQILTSITTGMLLAIIPQILSADNHQKEMVKEYQKHQEEMQREAMKDRYEFEREQMKKDKELQKEYFKEEKKRLKKEYEMYKKIS